MQTLRLAMVCHYSSAILFEDHCWGRLWDVACTQNTFGREPRCKINMCESQEKNGSKIRENKTKLNNCLQVLNLKLFKTVKMVKYSF